MLVVYPRPEVYLSYQCKGLGSAQLESITAQSRTSV